MIKLECQASGPKQTVHRVSDQIGGLLSSSCPGKLPRNERQAKHAKSVLKEFNPADELYSVMFQAKQEDVSNSFVRDMKVLPEPAVMLASDYQLDDLVRFGTNSTEHCVFTIDPTFSLGKFDVTPITYRNLLLESRKNGTPPVCVGPTLIHYNKTFSTYLFFASSLVGLRKGLRNVCAFGTDGEEALADAFSHEFTLTVRHTCFIHKRRNIETKLKDNGFSTKCQQQILDDIFGKCRDGTMFEGLVDSIDVEVYNRKVEMLKDTWSKLDADRGKVFHQWFMKYEYHIIKDTMLEKRLGLAASPPL